VPDGSHDGTNGTRSMDGADGDLAVAAWTFSQTDDRTLLVRLVGVDGLVAPQAGSYSDLLVVVGNVGSPSVLSDSCLI
jgi:hypothetical protein